MNVTRVSLPEIAIIGKMGLCTAENNKVSELWAQTNAAFGEIAALGMKEKDGNYTGFWGAMSDTEMQFQPWSNGYTTGLYLAGMEVGHDVEAPEGWTRWVMPARDYLVADVDGDTYAAVFHTVLEDTIPAMNLRLAGAVCDFTEPSTGRNKLFFPVAERS